MKHGSMVMAAISLVALAGCAPTGSASSSNSSSSASPSPSITGSSKTMTTNLANLTVAVVISSDQAGIAAVNWFSAAGSRATVTDGDTHEGSSVCSITASSQRHSYTVTVYEIGPAAQDAGNGLCDQYQDVINEWNG